MKLETLITSRTKPAEVEFELSIRHAYHHLNTSWHARHTETEKYRNLTEADFKAWSQFPKGFDDIGTYGDED